jgi:hypothetical protein
MDVNIKSNDTLMTKPTKKKLREIYEAIGINFDVRAAKKLLGLPKDTPKKEVEAKLRQYYHEQKQESIQTKKIQEQKEKKEIKKELKQIKKASIVLDSPDNVEAYDAIMSQRGDVPIRITVLLNGKIIEDFIVENMNRSPHEIYSEDLHYTLFYISEFHGISIFDAFPKCKLVINTLRDVQPKMIEQAFKQGVSNCVFTPMIEWAEKKRDEAQTKKTCQNYTYRINAMKHMESQFRASGVKECDLQGIANTLQVDITINQPFQKLKPVIEAKCSKKPIRRFEFINTRLNHVDLNEVLNTETEFVSYTELQDCFSKLTNENTFFTYTRDTTGISSIYTLRKKYKVHEDFQKFTQKFEEDTGIDATRLDDFKDVEISQFVRQGTHFNETIDFVVEYDEYEDPIKYNKPYSHIDQERAYINYKKCQYYCGFLGKITDFRQTDRIVDVGMYRITNLVLTGKLKELNDKMYIYSNHNIYPSPELNFIKDHGGTFTITEGCWGTVLDFDMQQAEWCNKDKKVNWYAKWVGCMACKSTKHKFYMQGDEDYFANMRNSFKDDYKTFRFDGSEAEITFDKCYNQHLSHIASFITSYTRLNTLEQLMIMDTDDIIRVCVDGIYFKGAEQKYPLKNSFRVKPDTLKKNITGSSYISNAFVHYRTKCTGEFREHYMKELHVGCGGSGKTHGNLIDTGFIRPCYVAPSWKLARNKSKELGVRCNVWHQLLCDDPTVYRKFINGYNILLFDEISMLDDQLKEKIFERYKNCKIIMCGDPGYQLDGFSVGHTVYKPFECSGFDNMVEHNTNYRVKCPKLLKHLNKIRQLMKAGASITKYVKDHFNYVDTITDYVAEDMILTRTHEQKDKYTKMFDDINKYYVTETDREYCKGEIVINEKPAHSELRHGYTIHSVQGETCENRVYIDMHQMTDPKAIYTSISRARRWEQVYLTNGGAAEKNKYSRGKIYKLYCPDNEMVYIGSTTCDLDVRFNQHKHELNKCTSKRLFESGEVRIELIEEVCCKSEAELVKREGEIMRLYPNRVNKFLAGRTQAEYVRDKKVII